MMQLWLKCSNAIDQISEKLGTLAAWTVLLSALISAGNAFVRYGLDISSNGWLEIQWYLFAATVMIGAPMVLKRNEHVRVDLVYGSIPSKVQVYIDLLGLVFLLLPVMSYMAWLSWPLFIRMLDSGEVSSNAGGLVRWPAMMLLPVGFSWVSVQGLSEIIKRIAHLRGVIVMDTHYEKPVQ
jgi:TRAP-type mannitol/chloroaromatic compound transport system permease small subunit